MERKSNFELLRIVSILMIITIHYLLFMMDGDFSNLNKEYLNYHIVIFVESFCIIGVNLFVLISAYFMIDKKFINIKKVVLLIFNTIFYGVILFLIEVKVGNIDFSIKKLIASIGSSLIYNEYWFIKIYIVLFILTPFLNISLTRISKKMYIYLLIILSLALPVLSSFLYGTIPLDTSGGYSILHFIYLYCIGGYIKIHLKTDKKYFWLIGYIVFATITSFIATKPYPSIYTVWSYNYIFNVLSSVCLFIYFSKINIQSKIVNVISSTVLGIYLIHINRYISPILYSQSILYWNSNMFLLNLLETVILIFLMCFIIDLIKEFIFKKTIYKLINTIKIFNLKIGED